MRKSFSKFIVFWLVLCLNYSGILAISDTFAYFNDTETSTNNNFEIGTLDFSLSSSNNFSPDLKPSQTTVRTVSLSQNGTLPFQYKVKVENATGGLCSSLNLKDDLTATYEPLANFVSTTTPFSAASSLSFTAQSSSYDASLQGEVCKFDLVFKAWQTNLSDNTQGFSDTETISNTIKMGYWDPPVVLNEILPHPSGATPDYGFDFGTDGDSMPQGEWVELYNKQDSAVNLAGWQIGDEANHRVEITSLNTAPATTTIDAHSWLVVYLNQAILNNSGSDGNPADTVYLYNQNNSVVDSYSYYGTNCSQAPTPGATNGTTTPSACSQICTVPGNKSYARIPDGSSHWVDPYPTPGKPNTLDKTTYLEEMGKEAASLKMPQLASGASKINAGVNNSEATSSVSHSATTPSTIEVQQLATSTEKASTSTLSVLPSATSTHSILKNATSTDATSTNTTSTADATTTNAVQISDNDATSTPQEMGTTTEEISSQSTASTTPSETTPQGVNVAQPVSTSTPEISSATASANSTPPDFVSTDTASKNLKAGDDLSADNIQAGDEAVGDTQQKTSNGNDSQQNTDNTTRSTLDSSIDNHDNSTVKSGKGKENNASSNDNASGSDVTTSQNKADSSSEDSSPADTPSSQNGNSDLKVNQKENNNDSSQEASALPSEQ